MWEESILWWPRQQITISLCASAKLVHNNETYTPLRWVIGKSAMTQLHFIIWYSIARDYLILWLELIIHIYKTLFGYFPYHVGLLYNSNSVFLFIIFIINSAILSDLSCIPWLWQPLYRWLWKFLDIDN